MDLHYQWLGRQDYQEAWDLQKDLVEQRLAGEIPDTVLFLEHDPVYTMGKSRDRSSIEPARALNLPVVEINRGGEATYHGPGQLTGYLILDLRQYGQDLHAYLRALEEALIQTCRACGMKAGRRDGLTGVWIANRKIASIGVGVRRWISMHGFAINVARNISGFESIVPCGIHDVQMTSVELETNREISVQAFSEQVKPHLENALRELSSAQSEN